MKIKQKCVSGIEVGNNDEKKLKEHIDTSTAIYAVDLLLCRFLVSTFP